MPFLEFCDHKWEKAQIKYLRVLFVFSSSVPCHFTCGSRLSGLI